MTRALRRQARGLVSLGLALALLGAVAVLVGQAGDPEDWANSPEAYFLTKEERAQWYSLSSRDERASFKERYWLKRDPSPGTGKNEFQEMVLSRIKTADQRFPIENTPGSRTARGLVFIVLGTPARARDVLTPRPAADSQGGRKLGVGVTPVATFEGNETTVVWSYDRERTARILEIVGRPSLEIRLIVEPSRHKDSIQSPGLFNEIHEVVAQKSIVNPDLVSPAEARVAAGAGGGAAPPLLPRQALSSAVRKILEEAPAVARHGGAFVGSIVIFRDHGEAETLLWAFTPPPSGKLLFHALVRSEDGREAAALSEPAAVSSQFSSNAPGLVALRRLTLPPGFYSASVALTEEGGKVLASAVLPLSVPALEKAFAVSSLLLTRGPAAGGSGTDSLFTFSGTVLPPRADAAFATSESLWYFVEVANPLDPTKVTLEPRLRRGAEPVASLPPFVAKLQPLGAGRSIVGVELPLSTLQPGDYVLYLTVRDGSGEDRPQALRRADFQIR